MNDRPPPGLTSDLDTVVWVRGTRYTLQELFDRLAELEELENSWVSPETHQEVEEDRDRLLDILHRATDTANELREILDTD